MVMGLVAGDGCRDGAFGFAVDDFHVLAKERIGSRALLHPVGKHLPQESRHRQPGGWSLAPGPLLLADGDDAFGKSTSAARVRMISLLLAPVWAAKQNMG